MAFLIIDELNGFFANARIECIFRLNAKSQIASDSELNGDSGGIGKQLNVKTLNAIIECLCAKLSGLVMGLNVFLVP
jgi:hypothetical protein